MNTMQQAAKMEYQERMKQRLAGAPMPLEVLMLNSAPITQQQLDAINGTYENRERIPEPLLAYADLYHELTGQEPTKRTFTDWLDTFYAWKDEKLQEQHIRLAWAQAQSDKGFTVGRPGALTVTAVGMKSKVMPALPQINTVEVERTKQMLEAKNTGTFVPRPANVARPRIGQPK
jgi:hypothetical protein